MQPSISIILCTYNESVTIEKTIKKIQEDFPESEIIIIDDNSNDGTQDIIKKLKYENINLICRKARGLASACLVGLIYSKKDIVCWIDSNQPNLVKEIPIMLNELKENDITLMSRYVEGGKDLRSTKRVLSSILINFLCRLILDKDIKDYTSGIFAMKKEVLIEVTPIGYGHGEYFIEFLYAAKSKGLKIKEIPFIQPEDGEGLSKTASSILRFLKLGLFYVIRILISKFKRR